MLICSLIKNLKAPRLFLTCSRAFSKTTWLCSHYKTLNLPTSATTKQIKEAYFTLSKKYHPDLHPNDPKCNEKFIELQEAYKILSNPQTRADYDSTFNNRSYGHSFQGNYSSQSQSQYYNQRSWTRPDFSKRDEWIRHERMKRERERQFQDDFGDRREFHNFNKYYSKPHNLTPEEMEFFIRQRQFSKKNRVGLLLLGVIFMVMFIESVISVRRQDKRYGGMMENPRRGPYQGYGFQVPPLDSDNQHDDSDRRFEDYLKRRDLRFNNGDIMYDDRDINERPS